MSFMEINPYASFFRSLREIGIHEHESRIVIRAGITQDQHTYNAPTASQVASIWVEDEGLSEPLRLDIVVYARSGISLCVRHYYGCYDPLQYTFLFPYDDSGWHRCIYKCNTSHRRREVCPTFPINEVLVQTDDDLIEAEDQVANSSESKKKFPVESITITAYKFALIIRLFYCCYGKPDIFLTLTCNPRWPEIERELLPHEEAQNRPDLVARVFRAKLIEVKKEIVEKKLFEVCSSIKAVKYLYKYIYKGHDRISFTVEDGIEQHDYDEISAFQSARWISPPEAVWRIFRFCMNEIHPTMVPLQVYLQNMETVLFRPYERLENIEDDDSRKRTMLIAFFEQNQADSYARTLLYQQFPEHYVWLGQKDDKLWIPRRKGFAIGRLVYTNPTEGSGISLGLLEDDNSVENSLLEDSNFQMPFALRRLFATLLIYCTPKSLRLLWDHFFSALSEDYTLAFPESPSKVLNLTLRSICFIIASMRKSFNDLDFGGLRLEYEAIDTRKAKEIEGQLSVPITLEELNAINLPNGAFFVDGLGGTSKTFLYSSLLAQLRKKGFIALAVASSEIAASNISGGRTSNSLFKIPLDLEENQGSKI
ncbi:uncharacterized protein LOC141601059 [Silene latifolia]|uniref:uncharacterized protein LOC141601059 n=1 Tax=Silene latifolia TaxID=37657 RepID=UPI003D783A7E